MRGSKNTERTQTMDGREVPAARSAGTAAAVYSSTRYPEIEDNTPAHGPFKVIKNDIRSDGRGRLTIGQEVVGDTQYRALMNELGQIILDPVVTVPARELWLLQNTEAFASLVRGVEQAKRGELGTFPSFAEYLEDDEEDASPKSGRRKRQE